jgi:hypothetical protein
LPTEGCTLFIMGKHIVQLYHLTTERWLNWIKLLSMIFISRWWINLNICLYASNFYTLPMKRYTDVIISHSFCLVRRTTHFSKLFSCLPEACIVRGFILVIYVPNPALSFLFLLSQMPSCPRWSLDGNPFHNQGVV